MHHFYLGFLIGQAFVFCLTSDLDQSMLAVVAFSGNSWYLARVHLFPVSEECYSFRGRTALSSHIPQDFPSASLQARSGSLRANSHWSAEKQERGGGKKSIFITPNTYNLKTNLWHSTPLVLKYFFSNEMILVDDSCF